MKEVSANLFLYLQGETIREIGIVTHQIEGDDQKVAAFLKSNVDADSARAVRFPLPADLITGWFGVDARNGLHWKYFDYLRRSGKGLWLFERALQSTNAPANPLVCVTPILNGKPQIDALTHANPLENPTIQSEEFGGMSSSIDWMAAYITPVGLNVGDLLSDDFLSGIKVLYAQEHYVSALKLLVSFIDTVAYIEFGDISGNFEQWLTRYTNLSKIGLVSSELWEFRNALLHMTNPMSRKVLAGKVPPFFFYVKDKEKMARLDKNTGTKMFSFEALYEALMSGVDDWIKSYAGSLEKQLEFIERYDLVFSEARLGRFFPKSKT